MEKLQLRKTHASAVSSGRRPFFKPCPTNIQRKCSACEREETMQRKETSSEANLADAITENYVGSLNGKGKSLTQAERSFFEPRFGYDFSDVQLHTNAEAHQSAKNVNALAYTHGNNIVFGSSEYQPETENGKRLLAHELTHVIQQGNNKAPGNIQKQPQAVPPQPQVASPLPQRGPNPSSCFTAICNTLAKPSSSCINDPRQCAQDFKKDVMSCLTANAAASNAANFSEILANTSGEIDNQIDYMNAQMPDLKKQEDKRQYIDWLLSFCKMKKREVWIEFNYNVIFENAQGQRPWVFYENEWDEIEAAIRAIPEEHLWGRSRTLPVVHFKRESFGPPSPTGTGQVGGDTDTSTGLIRIFDAGIGTAPYSRSKNIGVTATDQTLRHEVGHIVDATIPTADMNDFFQNIVQWKQYSWAWITTHPSIYPTWQAERRKVCDELNLIDKNGKCDETRLDSFFASVSSGNVTMNGRQYSKSPFFLISWPAGNVPSSVEFEYARTSQGEYFAELYALAISAPSFLVRSIPFAQVEWLKAHVFNTDALYKSIIAPYKNLAINASETLQTQYLELLNSADDMFTEQQLQSVSARLHVLLNQMGVPQANAALV